MKLDKLLVALAGSSPLKRRDVVPGAVFDRYLTVWFENTDFEKAAGDRKSPSVLHRWFSNTS